MGERPTVMADCETFQTHWYIIGGLQVRQDAYTMPGDEFDIGIRTEVFLGGLHRQEYARLPWDEAVAKLRDDDFRKDLCRRHLGEIVAELRKDANKIDAAVASQDPVRRVSFKELKEIDARPAK